jgi:hypothetical protein
MDRRSGEILEILRTGVDKPDIPHDSQACGSTPSIKQLGDNCLSYREKSAIRSSAENNTETTKTSSEYFKSRIV